MCDQCCVHPAEKWLIIKRTIDVLGYGSRIICQVRALCREYFEEWEKIAKESGAEVFTYDISEAEEVYEFLEGVDPSQLREFDESFRNKEY